MKEIGKLTFTMDPEALRKVVGDGRIMELADKVAKEAALQISAQVVEQVAQAALKPDILKSGVGANVSFIFEGGDFGTVPPRPKWGPVRFDDFNQSVLRKIATQDIPG
jgi:hypothetical protein